MIGLIDIVMVMAGFLLVCVPVVALAIKMIKTELPKFHFLSGTKGN